MFFPGESFCIICCICCMSESFYVPPDVREPSRFSGYQIFRNKILISTNPRNITLVRSYGECAAMCTADERGCYSVNVRQIPESEDLWKCELFWMATYSDSDLSLSIGDLYLVLDKMYYWRDWDTGKICVVILYLFTMTGNTLLQYHYSSTKYI